MFKGPPIGSCHTRSLLVGVRDSFYSASPRAPPGNLCSRWCTSPGWKTLTSSQKRMGVTEGDFSLYKETLPSVSAPAPSSLGCGHYLLKAAAHQSLKIHPKLPPLTQPKIRVEPRQCCMFSYLTQASKHPSSAAQRPAVGTLCGPALWNQSRALHQASPRQATALGHCLSLENEQRCRCSLGRNLKLYEAGRGAAHGKSQGRWASILVSLCSVQGEPAFLFTLRSSKLKKNKGDVSFAGGKNDPSDKDVVDTALREAREELGVTVATEKVWGLLKPLRETSGMMVAPVLANLGPIEDLSFKPNPEEVEEIFTLSLSHVVNPSNRGYTHFRSGDAYAHTLPVFHNGQHRVWGLTAVALDHALAVIASP